MKKLVKSSQAAGNNNARGVAEQGKIHHLNPKAASSSEAPDPQADKKKAVNFLPLFEAVSAAVTINHFLIEDVEETIDGRKTRGNGPFVGLAIIGRDLSRELSDHYDSLYRQSEAMRDAAAIHSTAAKLQGMLHDFEAAADKMAWWIIRLQMVVVDSFDKEDDGMACGLGHLANQVSETLERESQQYVAGIRAQIKALQAA